MAKFIVVGVAAAAIIYFLRQRRRRNVSITIREATKDDLEHMLVVANLKSGVGKDITGDGGDYVREAWENDWWSKWSPEMHQNEFAFSGELAVGFARVECHATQRSPSEPESGWLCGLRVHAEFQGQKVMSRLQSHLIRRMPAQVRQHTYMGVGSTNTQMVSVADGGSTTPRCQYIGAFVMHTFSPPADFRPPPADDKMVASLLGADAANAAWDFLTSLPLHSTDAATSRLLLPANFYAWRRLTRGALDDKLAAGRVYGVHARNQSKRFAFSALFVHFDDDFVGWPIKSCCRFSLCYFQAGVAGSKLTEALLAFGASQPTVNADTGEAIATVAVVGPFDNNAQGATGDLAPGMADALAASHFQRPRPTHLRVYRVPPPPEV